MNQNLKLILGSLATSLVAFAFLIAGFYVAIQARHYQLENQMMPNGKGGMMSPVDGYEIATVLLLFFVVWFYSAWRLARRSKEKNKN
jgi:hypothetical protein